MLTKEKVRGYERQDAGKREHVHGYERDSRSSPEYREELPPEGFHVEGTVDGDGNVEELTIRPKKRGRRPREVKEQVHVAGHESHTKTGKVEHVHGYTEERTEKKYGGGFKKLQKRVTREYMDKARKHEINPQTGRPYTEEDARRIGQETAAKVYWEKRGVK